MIVLTSTKEKSLAIKSENPDLEFLVFPAIHHAKPSDDYKALDDAIRSNHLYEWVFFLSERACDTFFVRLLAMGGNFFNLSNHLKFAVIGEKTKEYLEKQINMPADFMPSKADSETFIKEFSAKYKMEMDTEFKVLLPRSELAKDDFKEVLESFKNYKLDIVPAYTTSMPKYREDDLKKYIEKLKAAKAIVFSSTSCVINFFKITDGLDISHLKVYSIGNKTSKSFFMYYPNHKDFVESEKANFDSILKELSQSA